MSANAGPDIVEDGIVFYYDTGNTVKSYIGEPTTNYYSSFEIAMSNLSGATVTSTRPDGTTGSIFRVTVNSNSNTSRCVMAHNLPEPIPQANVRYTVSHWIRTTGAVPVAAGWEAEVGASDGYARPSFESGYVGDYGSFTQPNTITSTWQRVSYTFYYISTKTSALVPFIYFGSPAGGSGDSIGATIDFYGFQIEINSHVTPYTTGTRSVTQGLLDMTGNRVINIANVSFDSNAQMTFDGTNDYGQSDVFVPSITSKSYEAVTRLYDVNQQAGGVIGMMGENGEPFDTIVYNETDQGWGFGSTGFERTAWSGVKETTTGFVHLVATYENYNYKLYRNGVLILTTTSYAALNYNFNTVVIFGKRHGTTTGPLNGEIPLTKIYSRALTASEVLTNYNALKTRFGI
jgi:hypothetical protein